MKSKTDIEIERRRQLLAKQTCEDLLNQTLKISNDQGVGAEWILEWAGRQDELSEYGYKTELEEALDAARGELEKIPDNIPEPKNLVEQRKLEFFFVNFRKISLEALEWIVAEVEKKKIVV